MSYLYGAIFNIDDIIKLAKEHNLYVIEDCAESFYDTKNNGDFSIKYFQELNHLKGNPNADLSFFSFGSIKLNTAFGGISLNYN